MKKTFEYKGQMINYYNKVRKNPDIDFCVSYLDGITGQWTCEYWYSKKVDRSMKTKINKAKRAQALLIF